MAFTTILGTDQPANSRTDINNNFAKCAEGPSSSTDNAIARFDGITGKLLQNSDLIITDQGGTHVSIYPNTSGSNLIVAGAQSSTGNGGNNDALGGAAISGNFKGGNSASTGGVGSGSGVGGNGQVVGGQGGATGAGGPAIVQGGAGGATSGKGGDGFLGGGNATAGDSDGGDVNIRVGKKSGTGANGKLTLGIGSDATVSGILDLSLIASSNKTFTFPNMTGNLTVATSGAGAPTGITPVALGMIYVDTSGGKAYISTGTSTDTDWKILN